MWRCQVLGKGQWSSLRVALWLQSAVCENHFRPVDRVWSNGQLEDAELLQSLEVPLTLITAGYERQNLECSSPSGLRLNYHLHHRVLQQHTERDQMEMTYRIFKQTVASDGGSMGYCSHFNRNLFPQLFSYCLLKKCILRFIIQELLWIIQ